MSKYQPIDPEAKKTIVSIITGKTYNDIIKAEIIPHGRHASISEYVKHLIKKDLEKNQTEQITC